MYRKKRNDSRFSKKTYLPDDLPDSIRPSILYLFLLNTHSMIAELLSYVKMNLISLEIIRRKPYDPYRAHPFLVL